MNVKIKRRYTPIEKLLHPLNHLFQNQSTSAVLTFLAVVVAMIWANSDWSESYSHLWHTPLAFTIGSFTISESLHTWINDGLMAIFLFYRWIRDKTGIVWWRIVFSKKSNSSYFCRFWRNGYSCTCLRFF